MYTVYHCRLYVPIVLYYYYIICLYIYIIRRVSRIFTHMNFFSLILFSDELHGDENRNHTGRSRQDARAPRDNPVTFNPPLDTRTTGQSSWCSCLTLRAVVRLRVGTYFLRLSSPLAHRHNRPYLAVFLFFFFDIFSTRFLNIIRFYVTYQCTPGTRFRQSRTHPFGGQTRAIVSLSARVGHLTLFVVFPGKWPNRWKPLRH